MVYIFQLSNFSPLMREKWLVLLVTRTRLFMMAIAATRMSASDMRLPCSFNKAYISAALTMTSSVIGKTMLAVQNRLNSLICLVAFFAFSPLRISYFVMCEMFRCLWTRRYSEALANMLGFFLKSQERMSVSRRDGGYISIS